MSNHRSVVQSFLRSKTDRGCNLVSDGKTLKSYGHLVIAEWTAKGLIVYNYTSSGKYISTSTSRHVNMLTNQAQNIWTIVNPDHC